MLLWQYKLRTDLSDQIENSGESYISKGYVFFLLLRHGENKCLYSENRDKRGCRNILKEVILEKVVVGYMVGSARLLAEAQNKLCAGNNADYECVLAKMQDQFLFLFLSNLY